MDKDRMKNSMDTKGGKQGGRLKGVFIALLLFLLMTAGILLKQYQYSLVAAEGGEKGDDLNAPVSKEEIYALSPLDEKGAERIASLEKAGADETWTICVYMVGSDLEDAGISELSELMEYQASMRSEELSLEDTKKGYERLTRFCDELSSNGLGLPEYLYHPVKQYTGSEYDSRDEYNYEYDYSDSAGYVREGAASLDIREMEEGIVSDRVKIVLQTGGARSWTNDMINPNLTQRFLISRDGMEELENLPHEECFAASTLENFLRYCDDNFKSDRKMLVFWDHGGGPFGFGVDAIHDRIMSMKDIRQALSAVYTETPKAPPFDIIGFDACLMSNLDVMHYLSGYGKYYALSEETEPDCGWDYTGFLEALTDEADINPAEVARQICDSYMDFYMTQNINIGEDIQLNNEAFAVIDAQKGEELYRAYSDLAKRQLTEAVSDMSVLSEIGRCAAKSTHYADSYYDVYNLADLGNYADYMIDSYPDECSRIKELLNETVIYHRKNGNLSDSTGISVYIPGTIDGSAGFRKYLTYIYDVCEDDNVRALYYYQIAGCLNDKLLEYAKKLAGKEPQVLDITPFADFSHLDVIPDEGGFVIPGCSKLEGKITGCELELGSYDEEQGKITYYGNDNFVYPDGEGNLVCDYDGTWVFLDGVPLAIDMIANTMSSVEYRSRILYDGDQAYLVFTYDMDRDTFIINGVRRMTTDYETGIEFVTDLKKKERLRIGSTVTPLYEVLYTKINDSLYEEGDSVIITKDSRIKQELLPEGYYVCDAVISNQRNEKFYSKVAGILTGEEGIESITADDRFYARDY